MLRLPFRSYGFLLLFAVSLLASPKDENARALMDAGHWKHVRAQVTPRLQANPNDAEVAYVVSRVKQAFGDLDGAMQLAERAITLDSRTQNIIPRSRRSAYKKRSERGCLKD